MTVYHGPRRRVAHVERSADGHWILAVVLEKCGHRVVYRRRQAALRGDWIKCEACRAAAPASGAPRPGPRRGPELQVRVKVAPPPVRAERVAEVLRRRRAGRTGRAGPGLASRFPYVAPADSAARARAARERLDRLRLEALTQAERAGLEAARAVLRRPCGHVDHLQALEELGRALGQVPGPGGEGR